MVHQLQDMNGNRLTDPKDIAKAGAVFFQN